MNPAVSIITITYNAEQFLERTMLSILNQSHSDFEYLIIDGNSKDKTLEIIKNFESKINQGVFTLSHDRFHWISEVDTGLYDAMNKGLKMAKGDYIWFINAGDKIHAKDTLELILNKLNENPTGDVFYGQALMIDRQDNPLGERHKIAPAMLNRNSMLNGLVVCHQSILVKRDMAPLYDLQYRIASDYDWVIKVLKRSKQNIYIGQFLSDFMVAGTSSIHREKAWKERYIIMKKHFGLCRTLWAHCKIILKYPFTRKY